MHCCCGLMGIIDNDLKLCDHMDGSILGLLINSHDVYYVKFKMTANHAVPRGHTGRPYFSSSSVGFWINQASMNARM